MMDQHQAMQEKVVFEITEVRKFHGCGLDCGNVAQFSYHMEDGSGQDARAKRWVKMLLQGLSE